MELEAEFSREKNIAAENAMKEKLAAEQRIEQIGGEKRELEQKLAGIEAVHNIAIAEVEARLKECKQEMKVKVLDAERDGLQEVTPRACGQG